MNKAGEKPFEDAEVFARGDSGTAVVDRDAMKNMSLAFGTPVHNAENGTIRGKLDRVVQHVEERDAYEAAVGYERFVGGIFILLKYCDLPFLDEDFQQTEDFAD